MVIDKDSLQALNVALNDWDDNNRSSENYEQDRLRLEEIYSVISQKVNDIKNPEHTLNYSEDMVCEDCGSNEWHVNLSYNNRNGGWWYGEIGVMGEETGDEVWCHECEGWCSLVSPDEYEEGGDDDSGT
tara:strand:- start:127 stop:513 length:387 start_codon:yes stop_codon:yes gene_type:complete